jgi:hypothetical protein
MKSATSLADKIGRLDERIENWTPPTAGRMLTSES